MKIESVDLFYLSMPEVTTDADGSQDALLVRVRAGDVEGWGECEASPLTCIASFVCPMSHGVCQPVGASVLGRSVAEPADIARIAAETAYRSMDLLQAPHMLSGLETALWDLLGRARGEPVWRLLGYSKPAPKLPYASLLFGDTPHATEVRCREVRQRGFRAVKLGWGPFGRGGLEDDAAQLEAARAALGAETILLVDAGQVWNEDVEAAAARMPALERAGALWLEEPFHAAALEAYGALAARGTEDHTFTSHLALSASLQPYAGLAGHELCEFPAAPRQLALDITSDHLAPDGNGEIVLSDLPGLGLEVDTGGLGRYLVEAEITVAGRCLYRTPAL